VRCHAGLLEGGTTAWNVRSASPGHLASVSRGRKWRWSGSAPRANPVPSARQGTIATWTHVRCVSRWLMRIRPTADGRLDERRNGGIHRVAGAPGVALCSARRFLSAVSQSADPAAQKRLGRHGPAPGPAQHAGSTRHFTVSRSPSVTSPLQLSSPARLVAPSASVDYLGRWVDQLAKAARPRVRGHLGGGVRRRLSCHEGEARITDE
jgi:hypothetical protein